MIRRIQLICATIGVLVVMAPVWLWAQSTTLAQMDYRIKADNLKVDIKSGGMIYSGDVKFTSDTNSILLKCQRLEAKTTNKRVDGKTVTQLDTLNARGGVEFSALFPKSDNKELANGNKLDGRAQQLTYTIPAGKKLGIVRLEKAGGIQPTLTLSDMNVPNEPPMVLTGSLITIDLETEEVNVSDVDMEKKGDGK